MIKYYLKESINSIFNAKLAAAVTILVTLLAIILFVLTTSLVFFSETIQDKLKSEIIANVFLYDFDTQDELNNLITKITVRKDVADVVYIDKDTAADIFIKETGEDFSKIIEANPLPASLRIKFIASKIDTSIITNLPLYLKKDSNVEEIIFENTAIFKIINYIESTKTLIYGVSLCFILFSVYLIYSTSILIIENKKEQYETMKLVGTRIKTIKIPLFLTNSFLSLISSLIGFSLLMLFVSLIKNIFSFPFLPVDMQILIFVYILIIGQLFGYLGYRFSTKKISLKINTF